MTVLSKLRDLITPTTRSELGRLALGMAVVTVLEAAGVGLFLPLLQAVLNPEGLTRLPVFGPFLAEAATRAHQTFVLWACLGALVFFVLKNLAVALLTLRQHQIMQAAAARFSTDLLHLYLRRPYLFHLERNSADLVTVLRNTVQRVFTRSLSGLIQIILEIVVAMAIIAVLMGVDPVATTVVIVVLTATLAVYYGIVRRFLAQWGERIQHFDRQALLWANQALGSFKQTRLSGRESYFVAAYRDAALGKARYESLSTAQGTFPRLLIESVGVGGLVAVVISVVIQDQPLSDVVPVVGLFAVAALRLMPAFSRIMSNATLLREGVHPLGVVHRDWTEANSAFSPARITSAAVEIRLNREIRFENVGFRYPGASEPTLADIALTVRQGEIVAFMGRSGAGKSTLIDVLLGLLETETGRVTVDGIDIGAGLASWQRHIGYVPQHIYLLDDTLRRNVALGHADSEIDEDKVMAAIRMARLEDLVASLPDGLSTPIGEAGTRLSGGQRQRIGIARALYDSPELLVLDEATSALDHETEREVTETILGLRGVKTVVIIAHRIATVRFADTLVLMENGRIVASGPFDTVLTTSPWLRAMVSSNQQVI